MALNFLVFAWFLGKLTWSRVLNDTRTSSLLDHIYVKDLATIVIVRHVTPLLGDHNFVFAELNFGQSTIANSVTKHDWSK